MHPEEKISKILDEKRPTLSRADKDLLWGTIEAKVKTTAPTLSPYVFIFNLKNYMAPLALALILMLGTSGVVAASESARPGDTLFLVDQTVEDIRLALASDDKKTLLEGQFAAERLQELSSILSESINRTVATTTNTGTSSTAVIFEAEADVFTDTTIVEVEINDRKTIFETTATTRDAIVTEIVSRFGVARATVEASLDFETEDRSSRAEERSNLTLSSLGEERANQALALTLNYLTRSNITNEAKDALYAELATLLDGVPVKLDSKLIRNENNDESRVRIHTNGTDDSRIEIRDGEDRIRIREKNGEIRIDTKGDWGDDNEDESKDKNQNEDEDDDSNATSTNSTFEAEADVFTDTTIVEVEINDRKTIFETTATTRDAIVTEIVSRFGVARATVEASLDFETEDRSSLTEKDEDNSRLGDGRKWLSCGGWRR